MIELRTLGALDLRDDGGGELSTVLAHSKRTALLVYLAIARPHGMHRRDTLLGLFWPELDQEHARASLRKAIHHLRRAVGDDVLLGRGDEELGLDRSRFNCDATAFDIAIETGDLEHALELYRGPLLPGFFLADTPEFERWLEEERARLRAAAFDAAWRLADRGRLAGDSFGAAEWARRATTLMPDNEPAVRRLVDLLDDIGDRAGAIRAYEDFARHLSRDFDLEPSAETVAAIERIRARDAVPAPHRAADVATAAPPTPVVQAPIATRPRLARPALIAGIGLLVLAAGWTAVRRIREARVTRSPTVVAVFPFSYRGSAEFGYLGEGMADLLGNALNGAGDIRTVDSRAVLAAANAAGREHLDPAGAGAIASGLRAGRFMLGDILEASGRLRIEASLYDDAHRTPPTVATIEGPVDSVFQLVDALTARLIAGASGEGGGEIARVAALTTTSLPALKNYLEGESAYRRGLFDKALDAFQLATSQDSTFALAWYRLSLTAEWFSRGDLERASAERAVQFMGRLSEHDRLMLQAFLAWRRGGAREAERLYQSVVGAYPDDVEAWVQLGEVWFHYGPLRGRSTTLSRSAWEHVVRLEPEHVLAIYHLARIASLEGNHRELDSLVSIARRVTPESERVLELRALRAVELDDSVEQRAVMQALADASDNTLIITVRSVLTYATKLASAARLAELLVAPRRSPEVRALGHVILAHAALARGRRGDARAHLALVEPLVPAWALEYRGYMMLSPAMSPTEAQLRELDSALKGWDAATAPPSHTPGLYIRANDGIHAELREYLLGELGARLNDTAAATQAAATLEHAPGDRRPLGASLAAQVRAEALWQRHAVEQTLAELDSAALETIYDLTNNSPFLSQARARFLRAEALHAAGHDDDAIAWYTSLGEVSPYELVYLGPALSRRAEISEAAGRRQAAIGAYERLIALWRDCDPDLRPAVTRAETRLRVLKAGS